METTVKAGRYEILGEIGRGAMGVVYRATDPVIGRSVAVKTIRLSEEGTGLSRAELLSRLQTEARAAGLLTHPNIVVVYDAGEENGLYYITMELVEGKSVQALLDNGHSFPTPRVLRILEQTCSALQFAHERNIVHRDIKPANLMLTADDTVKVTDFGTAKILQFGTVQQTTHVMGTPSYMSPEQVKGRPVDGRSDIFSLGVMFYEMLTGEKPFPGQSITTVIYKIVNEEPIPPRQLNPSIHPGLNEIVLRALAKEPEARYQSCRELLDDLKNYRAIGGHDRNPDATLVSPRGGSVFPLGSPGATPRPAGIEDPATIANLRSLQNRAAVPTQTPSIRRTGPVQPYVEPKKSNPVVTTILALILVGVIIYGGYVLRPELQAARARNNQSQTHNAAAAAPSEDSSSPAEETPSGSSPEASNVTPPPVSAERKPEPVSAVPAASKKSESNLTPAAAEYKGRIEEALSEKGLSGHAKVSGNGNGLILSGKLRPAEHAALLKFMRNAPPSVRVVDDIQYEDAPLPASEKGANDGHPVPSPGNAAVHVITDVLGAKVTLFGLAGKSLGQCVSPCSFNDLVPQRYSLQIQKDGYLQVQTALELKTGEAQDQKIHLESLTKGLYLSSRPVGADIFINGAKQSGQTPASLPLAPGQYDLVVRLAGYDPYVGRIQVKDNVQTTLDVELKERAQQTHVAWAQIASIPKNAEIFVDGVTTGQFTPARVQISSGSHVILLKLDGFQPIRRGIQASDGGTVLVTESLKQKP